MIAGGVIGVLAPCLLSLIFNERAWDEYADYYGPGYHRLLGLLTQFPGMIPFFSAGLLAPRLATSSGSQSAHTTVFNREHWPAVSWLERFTDRRIDDAEIDARSQFF